MARAYSGVLGTLVISVLIVRGLLLGAPANEVLSQCLVMFPLFACVGFWIGYLADKTVRESVENRFRSEMASLHTAAAGDSSEQSE